MNNFNPAHFGKIVNPSLALTALHSIQPYGEFKALVKLAKSGFCPPGLKGAELYAPDLLKARIPCDQIRHVVANTNVISVELQEYVTSGDAA